MLEVSAKIDPMQIYSVQKLTAGLLQRSEEEEP